MKGRTNPKINLAQVRCPLHGRLEGEVEAPGRKPSSVRLGVWALCIGNGESFLKQRCNKAELTTSKLIVQRLQSGEPRAGCGPGRRGWFDSETFCF